MKRLLFALAGLTVAALAFAATASKPAEPQRISHGEKVNLTDYLVPGKTTVFDFTSKFCGPCRGYDQPLHDLHAKRADIAVVKVDINRANIQGIDWQSPVARQFDLHSIPHFKVYSPQGKLIAEDKIVFGPDGRPSSRDATGRKMVDAWINGSAN